MCIKSIRGKRLHTLQYSWGETIVPVLLFPIPKFYFNIHAYITNVCFLDSNNDITIDKWTGELKLTSRDVIERATNMTVTVKISDSARPQPNSIQEDISIYFVDDTANELLTVIAYNIKVRVNMVAEFNVYY